MFGGPSPIKISGYATQPGSLQTCCKLGFILRNMSRELTSNTRHPVMCHTEPHPAATRVVGCLLARPGHAQLFTFVLRCVTWACTLTQL